MSGHVFCAAHCPVDAASQALMNPPGLVAPSPCPHTQIHANLHIKEVEQHRYLGLSPHLRKRIDLVDWIHLVAEKFRLRCALAAPTRGRVCVGGPRLGYASLDDAAAGPRGQPWLRPLA